MVSPMVAVEEAMSALATAAVPTAANGLPPMTPMTWVASGSLARGLEDPAAGHEAHQEAQPDHEQRVVGHVEGDELDGQRGADVGAEDDAERLAEGHEAGRDETDEHQDGGRRGLQHAGDDRARDNGQP